MAAKGFDFDFGFTAMDADELDTVVETKEVATKATETAMSMQEKCDKVEEFRDKLTEIYNT